MMRLVWVLVIVAAVAALFFYAINRDPIGRDEVRSRWIGNPTPSFELATYERFQDSYGNTLSINPENSSVITSSTENTPIVINFWASWCAPCRSEAPLLEEMWSKYQSEVLFLGVNTQDRIQTNAISFLDEFNWTFPNVFDEGSRVGIKYGILGLPETFFIKKDGTVSFKHAGPLTAEIFERELQKIIQ